MSGNTTERFVATEDIRTAIKKRETEILDGLHIDWKQPMAKPHINCPHRNHTDNNPSWRWDSRKQKAFCTCGSYDIFGVLIGVEGISFEKAKIRAAEILRRPDLIREQKVEGEGDPIPPAQPCNRAMPNGYPLRQYAADKLLSLEFLHSLGISEITVYGAPAVRIPYRAEDGSEAAVRFRIASDGRDRFRWRSGSKPCLYGLDRLGDARRAGHVLLVEGESDSHTLWFHDIPALGLPGNTQWNESRDAPVLDGIPAIYLLIEPDQGGETMLKRFAGSSILPAIRVVRLPVKDPSELHIAVNGDHARFRAELQAALDNGEPYQAFAERESAATAEQARDAAGDLIGHPDILGRFAEELGSAGLVGEDRNAKILFLALTTRLLNQPVSVAVKGPSSGGKSYTVEVVLRFFPPCGYWERTAMSDRALAYSDEDFGHRHLVLYEATGMTSDFASYLIRSLLSEGRIRYELVEKTAGGMKPRLIEKEGPTGLIVTTTASRLHPENETRLLSLTVKDTQEQTKAILRALARAGEEDIPAVDYSAWRAFQVWLARGELRVVVPFAGVLADLVPPVAVRLRRDFRLLRTLIQAHALLHREQRARDSAGRILAALDDYAAVRALVADLFAEGLHAAVKPETSETVEAVRALDKPDGASVAEIAMALRLDTSAASRRVKEAIASGYLANLENRKGKPARIMSGDALPAEIEILPSAEKLTQLCSVAVLRCCSVAPLYGGIDAPSLRPNQECGDVDDDAGKKMVEELLEWTA